MGERTKWTAKDIPFKVDRAAAGSLSKQMTDGLREAIVSGVFKPGTVLPTILEWSKLLGVSIRVPEAAVAALSREGLLTARKHTGCVVAPRRPGSVWNGRVLAVVPDGDHVYYQNVLVGRLRARVAEAGYLFSQTTVLRRGGTGRYDTRQLEHELASKPGFALLVGNRPELERLLSRSGVVLSENGVPEAMFGDEKPGKEISYETVEGFGKLYEKLESVIKQIRDEMKKGVGAVRPVDDEHAGCGYCPGKRICKHPYAYQAKGWWGK